MRTSDCLKSMLLLLYSRLSFGCVRGDGRVSACGSAAHSMLGSDELPQTGYPFRAVCELQVAAGEMSAYECDKGHRQMGL